MSTAHYFIAIPLPSSLKDTFSFWQRQLKNDLTYKQWPHKEDLHITLKFLGAAQTEQLKSLLVQLSGIKGHSPFQIAVGNVGTFGVPNKPRVLWAGVEKTEPLASLQKQVEQIAIEAGFPKENREYRPHITLAKKWDGQPIDSIKNMLDPFQNEKDTLEINKIVVYQIFPSRSPKYEVIQTYQLKGEG